MKIHIEYKERQKSLSEYRHSLIVDSLQKQHLNQHDRKEPYKRLVRRMTM
jgi:hypothetical protein